jgi:hypothetical protein
VRMNRGVGLLVCLFLAGSLIVAQSPNGTVSGIVLDPSGGLIVGANVLVINNATGVQYPGKANSEGYYVVSNIPPGTYRIQVSNSGFKTIIKPDIVVHVEDALAINFTLPIGAASEIVTVEGGAPLVNTENAAVSTVIDRNFVGNLPLNGRSFNTLLQLTPGVVIAPVGPGQSGQFSISGQRTDANNFTVDGVSANFGVNTLQNIGESGTGGAQAFSVLGGTSSLVSVDALQEFRIETSSFAAEFGRTPGGQVILTTRSGTNDFHGGAFDYFRNTVMDANDWFANAAGKGRAPEHHNDFGGFLGGPILNGKAFFFFSYEGARLDLPQAGITEVPSKWARTVAASPALAPYLNAYPQPDNQTVTPDVYTSQFTGIWANAATLNATSLRIDHTFNERFSIFGRYNYAPSQILQRQPNLSLSTLQSTSVNTQTLTAGVDMLLSPRISNTLRGNYSTQSSASSFALDSFGGAVPINPTLLLGGLPASENQGFFETFDIGAPYIVGPSGKNQTWQINFTDALAISAGSHQFKFGGDYRDIFLNVNSIGEGFSFGTTTNAVSYFASTVQQFLSTGAASFVSTSTSLPGKLLVQSLSLYGQDTWKVTPRVTVTYGLRWELNPAPSARGETMLPAWENTNDPAAIALAPFGRPMWSTTYGNFAPRVGLAYALNEKRDLVLRVGAGTFYDLGVGAAAGAAFNFTNSAFGFFPNVPLPITNLTSFLPSISLEPPFSSGTEGFAHDLKLPRSYQWNVALEKAFGDRQVVTATYVGQAGRDLLRQEALYAPNTDFQPGADFLLTLNNARSNYNALQLQFRRPLAAGLQVLLNYTWSHSLDNASNDVVVGLATNVISAASDYASSNFDVRQSFSGAVSYDVPEVAKSGPFSLLTKDWSIQTVIVARTGFPFNASLLSTSPDPGGRASSRPDLVPGQPIWIANLQAPGGKNLNPNAFAIPSTVRQGTEGRNDIAGLGLTQVDISLGRKFPIRERLNLQFRADAFNVLNHPNFLNPLGFLPGTTFLQSQFMLNQQLGGLSPLFQEGGPRSLQLSLKLTF